MARGDHLAVTRGWFSHHAIDLGEDEVIQYGSGKRADGQYQVEIVSLLDFVRGGTPRIVPNPATYSRDAIVARALSRVGESDYDLFGNNCEHFVNWCRTGRATSRQVNRAFERSGSALTKVATKSAAKVASPWLLAADAIQFGTEVTASRMGISEADARQAGRWAGVGSSVGIGAVTAGPVGAVIGLGYWVVGEAIGKAFDQD